MDMFATHKHYRDSAFLTCEICERKDKLPGFSTLPFETSVCADCVELLNFQRHFTWCRAQCSCHKRVNQEEREKWSATYLKNMEEIMTAVYQQHMRRMPMDLLPIVLSFLLPLKQEGIWRNLMVNSTFVYDLPVRFTL
jgi:hypothetical protein